MVPLISSKLKRPGMAADAGAERFESGANLVERNAEAPRRGDRRERVLDLEADASAVRERHSIERKQWRLGLAFGQYDRVVAHQNRRGRPGRGERRESAFSGRREK